MYTLMPKQPAIRKKRLTKKQQAELEWARKLVDLLREPYEMTAKRQRKHYGLAHALYDAYSRAYSIILDLGEC